MSKKKYQPMKGEGGPRAFFADESGNGANAR